MLKRFLKDKNGVAAIELVLLAPIFLIILISGFEVGRYVMIMNKLQSAGFTLASVIGQTWPATVLNACDNSRLTETTLKNITSGMPSLMEPFSQADDRYKVIVTSLQKDPNGNNVLQMRWRLENGALPDAQTEVQGAPDGAATIDDSAVQNRIASTIKAGENMLVLEAFYRYTPIFPKIFGEVSDTFTERTLAKRVYFYNRLGKAIYLPPTHPVVGEIECNAAQ